MGRLGGLARAKNLSAERRHEIAVNASKAAQRARKVKAKTKEKQKQKGEGEKAEKRKY